MADLPDLDLHHVIRPRAPWDRGDDRTECGLTINRPVWTRDEAVEQGRRLGRQRFAFVVCQTCWSTAERWPTFEDDPTRFLGRVVYGGRHRDGRLDRELRAIAALVKAHPAEFDQLLADLDGVTQLRDRRRTS